MLPAIVNSMKSSYQEASLSCSGLEEWQEGPQVLTYGAILICRKGKARLNVNYKDWELYEGAVITLFPNDVVELKIDGDFKSPETENEDFKSPETENGDCKSLQTANCSSSVFMSIFSAIHNTDQMNISSKYLTNIVNQVTGHTPKTIIDQYVILQIKMHLKRTTQSIKEMAWEFHFADVSFFCRYFKKHTGLTPQQIRE